MRIELKSVPRQLKIDGIITRARQVNVGEVVIQASRLEAIVLFSGAANEMSTHWAITYRSEDGAFIGNDIEFVTLKPASTGGHALVSIDVSVPECASVAEIEISIDKSGRLNDLFWMASGVIALSIASVWLVHAVKSLFIG